MITLLLVAAASSRPGIYVTEFGRKILGQTDAVVLATVTHIAPPFRGVSIARLEVTEHLAGYERAQALTLLFIEDYVAPDAFRGTLERATVRGSGPRTTVRSQGADGVDKRRKGAGVRLAKGEKGCFFLRRKGASYTIVGFVPLRDPLYASKMGRLKKVLEIEQIGALDIKAEKAKRLYLNDLVNDNPWERGNSARELMFLARRYPALFSGRDARRIAQSLGEEKERPIQTALERALRVLNTDLAFEYAREAEKRERERHAESLAAERKLLARTKIADLRAADLARIADRYRRAATGILIEFLADKAPIVRERAAQALAEVGGPSAHEPLRVALRREKDLQAALAMIYACGVLGDPASVTLLAAQLPEPARERAAIHALARVGTSAARQALEAHLKDAGTDSQELIRDLLREEFPERS